MKKGRFLWFAHRITERQKAGKARNIKGKQLKNSRSTASRQPAVRPSSPRDNLRRHCPNTPLAHRRIPPFMFFERKGRKTAPLSLFPCPAARFDAAFPPNLSVSQFFWNIRTDKFTNPSRTFRFFHTERGYNVVKSPASRTCVRGGVRRADPAPPALSH